MVDAEYFGVDFEKEYKGKKPLEIIDDKYKAKEATGVIDPSLIQTNNNKKKNFIGVKLGCIIDMYKLYNPYYIFAVY